MFPPCAPLPLVAYSPCPHQAKLGLRSLPKPPLTVGVQGSTANAPGLLARRANGPHQPPPPPPIRPHTLHVAMRIRSPMVVPHSPRSCPRSCASSKALPAASSSPRPYTSL